MIFRKTVKNNNDLYGRLMWTLGLTIGLFSLLNISPIHAMEVKPHFEKGLNFLTSEVNLKKDSTFTLLVSGNCGMCKTRIEEAAEGKGVKSARWQAETQLLTLTIDPKQTDKEAIKERIAKVGHDADGLLAPDEVYEGLHSCCIYPRVQKKSQESADEGDSQRVVGILLYENNRGDLTPIEHANVYWQESPSTKAQSDKDGVFYLPYEEGVTKTVILSYAGFMADTVQIHDPNDIVVINARENHLAEVTVSVRRSSNFISSLTPARMEVLSSQELFKAACCDLSESFETNASVDVVNSDAVTGSKQIQMLGLSGIYTQLTVENLPGPRGLATPLGLGSIAGSWIESIQISKGVGSVANGFENMTGQINVELKKPENSERLFFNVYGNDMGRTDLNLNVAQRLNDKWSVGFLLHDNFMFNKHLNFSNNGFRDIPTGNIFSGINRWKYENGRGLIAQFGIKYLKDDRIGGEIGFDPNHTDLSAHGGGALKYGIQLDINRYEVFTKIGYIFPENRHRSIGLMISGSMYDQDSFYGLRNYDAAQKGLYANLIYQDIIGSVVHKYRTGLSTQADHYRENYLNQRFSRREIVPGAFFEYTYSPSALFDVVAGIRGDYNNLYGWFATPRLHARYQPISGTTLRISAGRGQRTANILAENTAALASSRILRIEGAHAGLGAYGLRPEVSWNTGLSLDQVLYFGNRAATFSLELFRSDFSDQVVVDYENPRELFFYNLDGRSYANGLQTEFRITPFDRFEVRTAYRFYDVKTDFRSAGQRLQRPLVARHRGFVNLAYHTADHLWAFDYTLNITGQKRLPSTTANPIEYQLPEFSKSYATMNAQITRKVGKIRPVDFYVGAENLTNFFQKDPILAADQPFGNYFDTSMLWGPLSGRMIYAGMRFSIK